jgi:hypothetical protein
LVIGHFIVNPKSLMSTTIHINMLKQILKTIGYTANTTQNHHS